MIQNMFWCGACVMHTNAVILFIQVERGNIEMERDNLKREVRSKEDDAVRLRLTCSGFESQLI